MSSYPHYTILRTMSTLNSGAVHTTIYVISTYITSNWSSRRHVVVAMKILPRECLKPSQAAAVLRYAAALLEQCIHFLKYGSNQDSAGAD